METRSTPDSDDCERSDLLSARQARRTRLRSEFLWLGCLAFVVSTATACSTAGDRAARVQGSLSACQGRVKPWIGKTEIELLQSLGPPAAKSDDGKDGKIIEYHAEVDLGRNENVGGFSSSWTQYTFTLKSDFFVSPDGKIYLAKCIEGPTQTKTTD